MKYCTPSSILVLSVAALLWIPVQSQASSSNNRSSFPQVYGMRWSLGQHFSFMEGGSLSNQFYMVMFNTDQPLIGDLFLLIGNTRFTCSSQLLRVQSTQDHHKNVNVNASTPGDIEETYLHKCIIGNIQQLSGMELAKTVPYDIVLADLKIKQSVNVRIDPYQSQIIYTAEFRLPLIQDALDVLVIGDWGKITQIGLTKGYHDPMPCIKRQLKQNANLSMALFTGDLAYDLQGVHYKTMLKEVQVISSKMVFMVTPGNHDTVYHSDTFELFTASFYSPYWSKYYNYFYMLQLGKVVFLAYNPEMEMFDFKITNRLGLNFTEVFSNVFTDQVIKQLKEEYFTIIFSHYPIYCSDIYDDHDSCTKDLERFKTYRRYFEQMSMNLYLSGHVHIYERTKAICPNGSYFPSKNNTYNFDCPIYVVEGAGGNDFYVTTVSQYPLAQFSEQLQYNTGFGVLHFDINRFNSIPTNVTYQHIDSQTCSPNDHFAIIGKKIRSQQTNSSGSDGHLFLMLIKIGIVSLGITAIVILAVTVSKRYAERTKRVPTQKSSKDHVQMVQEQLQVPNPHKESERRSQEG